MQYSSCRSPFKPPQYNPMSHILLNIAILLNDRPKILKALIHGQIISIRTQHMTACPPSEY